MKSVGIGLLAISVPIGVAQAKQCGEFTPDFSHVRQIEQFTIHFPDNTEFRFMGTMDADGKITSTDGKFTAYVDVTDLTLHLKI